MICRCPLCSQLFFNDDQGFWKHTELHASIDLLNGNPVCCPFCLGVELTTFGEWDKHRQEHEYTNGDQWNEITLNNCIPLSPVAGPSGVTSVQTGRGSEQTNDNELPYSFTQVREKTFKNGVKDRHFRVKFDSNGSLEGRKLSTKHDGLSNSQATNN